MTNVIFDVNVLMGTDDFHKLRETFLKTSRDHAIISLEALRELDGLKNADGRKGFQARRAIRKIKENFDSFEFKTVAHLMTEKKTNDELMVELTKSEPDSILVTNDIAMEVRARADEVKTFNYYESKDVGKGHVTAEVEVSGSVLPLLKGLGSDLEVGEYLIVNNYNRFQQAFVKLEKDSYEALEEIRFKSDYGAIEAKDPYQLCAMDSLESNQLTVLTGKAGSGKTLLAVSKLLMDLGNGVIDRIVIFTNPTKARGAEELGFYTGDRTAKLLQNSIGAILASKLGGQFEVERLIMEEKILIMPMSDIRGYEVPANSALYISEAQNASADLLQLAIQRAADGQIVIEGDPYTQLDHWSYGGENNGMLRLIEVFKAYGDLPRFEGFAHVHLPNIYRSLIAERANLMTGHD